MRYEWRFIDSPVWVLTTEDNLRIVLRAYYDNVDVALEQLRAGKQLYAGTRQFRAYIEPFMVTVLVGKELCSLNRFALAELIRWAKKITKDAIWYEDEHNAVHCCTCDVDFEEFGDPAEAMEDECNHAEHCDWRNLKEALGNLDNEGYTTPEYE